MMIGIWQPEKWTSGVYSVQNHREAYETNVKMTETSFSTWQ